MNSSDKQRAAVSYGNAHSEAGSRSINKCNYLASVRRAATSHSISYLMGLTTRWYILGSFISYLVVIDLRPEPSSQNVPTCRLLGPSSGIASLACFFLPFPTRTESQLGPLLVLAPGCRARCGTETLRSRQALDYPCFTSFSLVRSMSQEGLNASLGFRHIPRGRRRSPTRQSLECTRTQGWCR